MYLAVLLLVVGWAALLTSPVLIVYALSLYAGFHLRVLGFEEPWLEARFGDEWRQYRSGVRRWLPRLSPLKGGA